MSEIVEDIVREMREVARNAHNANMAWFADRIDAAYKRDIQTMVDAGVDDMQTAKDEATKLREENERLKAALKHADMMEHEKKREKKYEYAQRYDDGLVSSWHDSEMIDRTLILDDSDVVRREVGEWEEVPNG